MAIKEAVCNINNKRNDYNWSYCGLQLNVKLPNSPFFIYNNFLHEMLLQKQIEDSIYLGPYQIVAFIEEGS